MIAGQFPRRRFFWIVVNKRRRILYNIIVEEPELEPCIQNLRDLLDEVDEKIVRSLNERVRLVQELASVKGEAGVLL